MYDAIVVGARCAGSPTAMLLARKGSPGAAGRPGRLPQRHALDPLHPPARRGLPRALGPVREVAAPRAARRSASYTLDVGRSPFGRCAAAAGEVADALLAAPHRARPDPGRRRRRRRRRGARALPVDELLTEGDARAPASARATRTEHARIVIGADGLNSLVARSVGRADLRRPAGARPAPTTRTGSGVEMDGAELYPRPDRMIVAAPTNDGQVVTIVFWPRRRVPHVRIGHRGHLPRALELAPALAARMRDGTRADRFRGTAELPNFFRRPYGHGLGAGRRRRLPQGPDPGPRDQRRLPRR